MKNVLHIASGESVADSLRKSGIVNVFAFNEAMCEGEADADILSENFCLKRSSAYSINRCDYTHFADELGKLLFDAEALELYFDYDMFCAVNTITLLAYLEIAKYRGTIEFNLVEHNGTADIIKSFPIGLGIFKTAYSSVLINRTVFKTGIKHIDKGIELYIEYKKSGNDIIRYIKKNCAIDRETLCKMILTDFPEYGIGDNAVYNLIDKHKTNN